MDLNYRVLVLIMSALSLLSACSKAPPPEHEEIRPVRTLLVGQTQGSVAATYTGEIRARYESQLGFRTSGKIVARLVDVGSHVQHGQPLLQLDAAQESLQVTASGADVDAAQSRVAQAQVDLARTRTLLSRQFASQAEVDHQALALQQAEAQLRAALAHRALSENLRAYTVLTADRDGVVSALRAEVGQVVSAGQSLLTLAVDGAREVQISIPESRVDELRQAQALQVGVWALPGRSWAGRLRELAPDADSVTRTYAARISIEQADPAQLRLGMTATVQVPDVAGNHALRLPLTALVDKDGKRLVWLVDGSSERVSLREVQLGSVQGDSVFVTAGLQDGETVVVAGVHQLQPGQRVRITGADR